MAAFVALRDGCVTNEDELREHARRRLADLSEHWLVVHRAVHCRFSQMSGTVEAKTDRRYVSVSVPLATSLFVAACFQYIQ